MTLTPAPLPSIEHFAELGARLANPFADRRTALLEERLDEPALQHLAAYRAARPAAEGATLAPRITEAGVAVRALRGAPPLPPKPGAVPCDEEILAPLAGRSRALKIEGNGISARGDTVASTVDGDARVARCQHEPLLLSSNVSCAEQTRSRGCPGVVEHGSGALLVGHGDRGLGAGGGPVGGNCGRAKRSLLRSRILSWQGSCRGVH